VKAEADALQKEQMQKEMDAMDAESQGIQAKLDQARAANAKMAAELTDRQKRREEYKKMHLEDIAKTTADMLALQKRMAQAKLDATDAKDEREHEQQQQHLKEMRDLNKEMGDQLKKRMEAIQSQAETLGVGKVQMVAAARQHGEELHARRISFVASQTEQVEVKTEEIMKKWSNCKNKKLAAKRGTPEAQEAKRKKVKALIEANLVADETVLQHKVRRQASKDGREVSKEKKRAEEAETKTEEIKEEEHDDVDDDVDPDGGRQTLIHAYTMMEMEVTDDDEIDEFLVEECVGEGSDADY
jgi:hypothetical protein